GPHRCYIAAPCTAHFSRGHEAINGTVRRFSYPGADEACLHRELGGSHTPDSPGVKSPHRSGPTSPPNAASPTGGSVIDPPSRCKTTGGAGCSQTRQTPPLPPVGPART